MYLVTGGAGFIGSHLVARLVGRGDAVRVFDDFSSGRRTNLDTVRDRIEVVTGDVRDIAALQSAVTGCSVVFHLAADASVPRSLADPRRTLDVNVTGTLNLLIAARDAGCRRVVFASSCAVYGDDPGLPKTEGMLPAPLSPYAASKLAGENLCGVFSRVFGLEAVALRYFNVYGPRQAPASDYAAVIPRFLSVLAAGMPPTIYGDGEQSRDFIYVDDVVTANLRAAAASGIGGRVFNIAAGVPVTLHALLRQLETVGGRKIVPIYVAARPGDIRQSWADISAARSVFGYEPRITLEEGLRLTASAFGRAVVATSP